jgi:transcriptional regulator with XRE-family HTH domain
MAEKEKSKPSPRKITVLRQLRERAGLSREQLVARLDNRISLRTLQRWENLGSEPAMTRVDWLNLCKALNVRWDDLPVSLSGFVEVESNPIAV